ncbi:MAG: hypothetical protein Gyms2KO_35950 [Gymnodinialimonas sp.]
MARAPAQMESYPYLPYRNPKRLAQPTESRKKATFNAQACRWTGPLTAAMMPAPQTKRPL